MRTMTSASSPMLARESARSRPSLAFAPVRRPHSPRSCCPDHSPTFSSERASAYDWRNPYGIHVQPMRTTPGEGTSQSMKPRNRRQRPNSSHSLSRGRSVAIKRFRTDPNMPERSEHPISRKTLEIGPPSAQIPSCLPNTPLPSVDPAARTSAGVGARSPDVPEEARKNLKKPESLSSRSPVKHGRSPPNGPQKKRSLKPENPIAAKRASTSAAQRIDVEVIRQRDEQAVPRTFEVAGDVAPAGHVIGEQDVSAM